MGEAGRMFDYLLDKIRDAEMDDVPFRHVEITEFLDKDHFEAIVGDRQIAFDRAADAAELLDNLSAHGYEIIRFPGAITSRRQYLAWLAGAKDESAHAAATITQSHITTEGFGAVYRLARYEGPMLKELNDFFLSDRLKNLLIDKFAIKAAVHTDAGIQKYLQGYEISPHPDIRSKALTWMLNLNPSDDSEQLNFHTHYLRLKDQWRFVSEFWRYNQDIERCWLPWDWCETVRQQTRNNSIVFFSPSDDTVHAVKADYDHLLTQRTQAYGNLWYESTKLKNLEYSAFDLKNSR